MEYENSKVHFKIDLSELMLKKLENIPVTINPKNDNEISVCRMNMEENKKDCLDGENAPDVTECCLA